MIETPKREYSLDVLKLLGTLCIILHHYQGANGFHFGPVDFGNGRFYFGYIVELFFMLSGFFAFSSIEKINKGLGFPEYFYVRYLRLLPLMTISTLVYSLFYFILWHGRNVYLYQIVLTCLGLQSCGFADFVFVNNHFWYLSALIVCYIFFYLLTWTSKKLKISPIYLYGAMVALGALLFRFAVNIPYFNSNTARGYMSFFLGLILASCLNGRTVKKSIGVLSLLIASGVLLTIAFAWDIVEARIIWIINLLLYPSLIVLFKTETLRSIFSNKIIGELGKISFDAYIWHFQLIFVLNAFIEGWKLNINVCSLPVEVAFIAVVFIGSAVSHYCIEKPIDRRLQSIRIRLFHKTEQT